MNARYTQGEWRVERAADGMNLWIGCDRYTIATVSHVANEVNMGEMEANATLIATSPDLLEAMQLLDEAYDESVGMPASGLTDKEIARRWGLARAAISKATGATHV